MNHVLQRTLRSRSAAASRAVLCASVATSSAAGWNRPTARVAPSRMASSRPPAAAMDAAAASQAAVRAAMEAAATMSSSHGLKDLGGGAVGGWGDAVVGLGVSWV
jgi:hypothetical protein